MSEEPEEPTVLSADQDPKVPGASYISGASVSPIFHIHHLYKQKSVLRRFLDAMGLGLTRHFSFWGMAWQEAQTARGFGWVRKAHGLVAFLAFTGLGLSLWQVTSWLFPALPKLAWLSIVLGVVVIVQELGIHFLGRYHERIEGERLETIRIYANQLSDANYKLSEQDWFYTDLQEDRTYIQNGLFVYGWELNQDYNFPSPSVEFFFYVFNGSLFKVFIGQEVDGFISYRTSGKTVNLELPVVMSAKWTLPDGLPRHWQGRLSMKQRLTKEEADFINADPNSGIGLFSFEHLKIMVAADPTDNAAKDVKARPLKFFCEGIRRNGTLS